MAVTDRASRVAAVVEGLERDMELLCLTGVEDKLQESVRPTLEMLRNAGIKVSHKISMLAVVLDTVSRSAFDFPTEFFRLGAQNSMYNNQISCF